MPKNDGKSWCPFRPRDEDLAAITDDVSEVRKIQAMLRERHKDLQLPDRVAHQYQIAGSPVLFRIADQVPDALLEVGLFVPGAEHFGIGRISTGLGTPHIETNPDFLGLMLAFQTAAGQRVDFLAINDAAAPTDQHQDFIALLAATEDAAGAEFPLIGEWGEYDAFNLLAEQKQLIGALKDRLGWRQAGRVALHVAQQTLRTFHSSTAVQSYWTGVLEVAGRAGKFTFVPLHDDNKRPGFKPGERYLSDDWKARQSQADIEFQVYWIAYQNEDDTCTQELTETWVEAHKQPVGHVTFPRYDQAADPEHLWPALAAEMGANPGNWMHDKADSIDQPATAFSIARKIAYGMSQQGRNALEPALYGSVFQTRKIGAELAQELKRRRKEKQRLGHVDAAPPVP